MTGDMNIIVYSLYLVGSASIVVSLHFAFIDPYMKKKHG